MPSSSISKSTVLQWGHGEFTVETGNPQFNLRIPDGLQWGHGEFTVETRHEDALFGFHLVPASMGPR